LFTDIAEPRVLGITQTVDTWSSAKTVAEAEDYARQKFGIGTVDYSGMDVDVARNVNKHIELTYQKVPELRGQVRGVVTADMPDALGRTQMGIIELNRNSFANERSLQAGFGKGGIWNSVDNGYGTVVHELGHNVDNLFAKRGYFGPDTRTGMPTPYSGTLRKNVFREAGIRTDVKRIVSNNLSEYATKNPSEFYAEAFAEWLMSPNPRKLARLTGDETMKILTEIRGK
jgi:hypothetical protein